MKYDVFISYSRKDIDEVLSFKKTLESRLPGIKCWFDIKDIESGDEFITKIVDAINSSSLVILALSENTMRSKWTEKEIKYAMNTKKHVIPILLRGYVLEGLSLFLFGDIDCVNPYDVENMEKFVHDLKVMLDKDKQNTSIVKSTNEFYQNRFLGRFEGLTFCILEKRDPKFDIKEMDTLPRFMWGIKSIPFANKEERDVLEKLVDIIKEKEEECIIDDKDEALRLYGLGLVEAASVINDEMNPYLLLEESNVL